MTGTLLAYRVPWRRRARRISSVKAANAVPVRAWLNASQRSRTSAWSRGADHALDPTAAGVLDEIAKLTDGEGLDEEVAEGVRRLETKEGDPVRIVLLPDGIDRTD
ncbi:MULTISPECIES: hypothetical protein [Streptomyces]|uniref:hypothetical protein n=1 Tax=Streptomyces TaxID=1883 RepID=UPI00163B8A7F|nr:MULTISPECIES: hypothetical protein [Streptomyces]